MTRSFSITLAITLVLALASGSGLELQAKGEVTFTATELLGRPTDSSVTVNVLADEDLEVYFEYGTESGVYTGQSDTTTFPGGEPIEAVIDDLQPNTRYYYRIAYAQPGEDEFFTAEEHTLHTQRAPGETFTFVIHADPHNGDFNSDLYEIAMENTLADTPDFVIDLGDNFMTEKLVKDVNDDLLYEAALQTFLDMRPYYGLVGHSTPLYLAIGNHEGELGWKLDGDADNVAVYSRNIRKAYYPNPIPEPAGFYSGSTTTTPYAGLDDSYYAWEWGDALFVVLDPFWYTTSKPQSYTDDPDEGWKWTLGEEQYYWFKEALEQSNGVFKFVFIHHLVGGRERNSRGGIEVAGYYEWGGRDIDENYEWDDQRGWEGGPIHDLMVANGVTAIFHGHDHFFGLQELDGIVYQECPRPNHDGYSQGSAEEAGYTEANTVILPNSGHLRVTVSPTEVTVDYVRAYLEGDGTNGEVAYSYTINADTPVVSDVPNQTVAYGESFVSISLDNYVTDSDDHDSLMVWTHWGEVELLVDITDRVATISVPYPEWNGSEIIWFKACDPVGLCDSNEATFTVMAPNDTPAVSDIPNQTIAEGESFASISLDNYVADPNDHDSLIIWTHWGQTELSVDMTDRVATISAPNPDWNGSETIWFKACDPGGLCDSNEAAFTVTAENDTPVVSDIPNQTVAFGESFASIGLDNHVTDPDDHDSVMMWTRWGEVELLVDITDRIATVTVPNPDWNGSETIWFKACDPGGLCDSNEATFTVRAENDTVGVYPDGDELFGVEGFSLSQNYPNPFNPVTQIEFEVQGLEFKKPVHTTLKIYNIQGELVRTLVDEPKQAGTYEVTWDGRDQNGEEVASGVYPYRLQVGNLVQARRMVLMK